jgi:rhamnulokinase
MMYLYHYARIKEACMAQNMTYYLAVDIGASSGRHMLGWMQDGRLHMEEVYRFPNGATEQNGSLCWDGEALYRHLIAGLAACRAKGKIPSYMAIDTWGVDYALLDEKGDLIGALIAYRDDRTTGMDDEVRRLVSDEELYSRTGIQKLSFNTVYQLMAHKMQKPDELSRAKTFLMVPDYLNYRLTGKCAVEYTDASTTALLDVKTGDWDRELLSKLGYPVDMFPPVSRPGTVLGGLKKDITQEIGFDVQVILPPSHDTASAVLALPSEREDAAYLSSGTWSLMGVERTEPANDEDSRRSNFTNEGGYDMRYRYLKNIMGLWMIQSVRRELNGQYGFGELSAMAREFGEPNCRVNVNDDAFLAPASMIKAVKTACGKDMELPELLAVIYYSLAEAYRDTLNELELRTGRTLGALYIIGGGSQDTYLNELTAKISGREVYTGVVEATATGNLLCQMLATGVFSDRREARDTVARSFDVKQTIVTI